MRSVSRFEVSIVLLTIASCSIIIATWHMVSSVGVYADISTTQSLLHQRDQTSELQFSLANGVGGKLADSSLPSKSFEEETKQRNRRTDILKRASINTFPSWNTVLDKARKDRNSLLPPFPTPLSELHQFSSQFGTCL